MVGTGSALETRLVFFKTKFPQRQSVFFPCICFFPFHPLFPPFFSAKLFNTKIPAFSVKGYFANGYRKNYVVRCERELNRTSRGIFSTYRKFSTSICNGGFSRRRLSRAAWYRYHDRYVIIIRNAYSLLVEEGTEKRERAGRETEIRRKRRKLHAI